MSLIPLYLIIGEVEGYVEERNGSKCLVFNYTDENKEVLEKYTELWDEIKNKIETINSGKEVNMINISWKLNLTHMMICRWINY